eukprot:SAG31_NODE_47897_length_209_cov_4.981818_1_plen_47_part_01
MARLYQLYFSVSHRQSSAAVASVSTSSGLDRDYDVVEWKLKVERRRC